MSRKLYTECPICASEDSFQLGAFDCSKTSLRGRSLDPTMIWLKCNNCEHEYTDGYFVGDELKELISKVCGYEPLDTKVLEKYRYMLGSMVSRIKEHKSEGMWLDVGFGNGSLLAVCEEYGFLPVGVDLRKESVDKLLEYDYLAYCSDFLSIAGSYSVISMADVLEHMPDPIKAINHAYDLLETGGVLFISCPNEGSLLWKMLTEGGINPYYVEIEHYHNFSRERLYEILEDSGFKPVSYSISLRYRIGMEIIARKI